MKNNPQTLVVGAERLKCNAAEYLLIKIHIAHTYLDFARTTKDKESRLRSMRRAANIAESVGGCPDELVLLGRPDIRRALAELRSRAGVVERKSSLAADAAVSAIADAVRLTRVDLTHFFVPVKRTLYAGDLLTLAKRLRTSQRLYAR